MRSAQTLTFLTFFLFLTACSMDRYIQKGEVHPTSFENEVDFITVKTVMMVPAEIDGETRNFLFDTGAPFNMIQRDKPTGKTVKISGGSNRKDTFGSETIPSFKIGKVAFKNTYALNGDMVGLKEQIPNFGGLIGQTVIKKANWLFDYPSKKVKVSNKDLSDASFKTINIIEKSGGKPYTTLVIDNKAYEFLIDFGSSSQMNIPEDSKLAKALLAKLPFEETSRDRYTVGGLQIINEKVVTLPKVSIRDLQFQNVELKINYTNKMKIGISLFRDYLFYIDNINGIFKVKKVK